MLDDPSVMALVHNYRDISGRRRCSLIEAEVVAVSEHAGAVVFTVDETGSVRTWHASCERLLGYTTEEAENIHAHSLVPPEVEAVDRARRSAVIETGERTGPTPTDLLSRGGKSIPVELVLAPLVVRNAVRAVTYIARPLPVQPL